MATTAPMAEQTPTTAPGEGGTQPGALRGKVAVVTGAGDGLGRAEALALAGLGAAVVVNDLGDSAEETAEQIRAGGGRAVAARGDIGDWDFSEQLVRTAVDELGSLDLVVNNAGILRDGMLFNLTERMWDDVIRVHLKGHAALCRAASVHWRALSKSTGAPVDAAVVNTASEAYLFGGAGQANYAAAKAGIVALTMSLSRGMARYGVRANAIAPRAQTAMTAGTLDDVGQRGGVDLLAPERVAEFVAYLASPAAARINGQVFIVYGDKVALLAPPSIERTFTAPAGVFDQAGLDAEIGGHFAGRPQEQTYAAFAVADLLAD